MTEECRVDVDDNIHHQEIGSADNDVAQSLESNIQLDVDSNIHHQEIVSADDEETHLEREIQLDQLDKKLLDEMKMTMEESGTNFSSNYYKIGWLPQILRQEDQKFVFSYCYPRELPIGPIYYYLSNVVNHDYVKSVSEKLMDHRLVNLAEKFDKKMDLKIRLGRRFINDYFADEDSEGALILIKTEIRSLRAMMHEQFYLVNKWESSSIVGDDELARMLFLDGCTIIQFIKSYLFDGLEEFGIGRHQQILMVEDLFLLQNQIPFEVIAYLLKYMKEDHRDRLKKNIVYFLHMNNFMMTNESIDTSDGVQQFSKFRQVLEVNDIVHLLSILHSIIIGDVPPKGISSSNENIRRANRDFRSVQELKAAGIKFKPRRSSGPISFSSKSLNTKGCLQLPPLLVDDWTKRKLMNLVAYEMCLPFDLLRTRYPITSYVKFMDVLIDKEEDIKELRASRVLRNRLSSDADAAEQFNSMGSECFDPPIDLYKDVMEQIEIHCQRKLATWIAQVVENHFSSPWTVAALLVAELLLFMSAIQTFYAVDSKK